MSDKSSDEKLAEEYPAIAVGLCIVIEALKDNNTTVASKSLYLMAEHLDGENDG